MKLLRTSSDSPSGSSDRTAAVSQSRYRSWLGAPSWNAYTSTFTSSCDVAKAALVARGVPYRNEAVSSGASVRVGSAEAIASYDATLDPDGSEKARFEGALDAALTAAAYPKSADLAALSRPKVIGILFILMLYVTMVYGPVAAMLVELFPTRIRYTSMSLPYHIGNGWFGGFLPTTSFAIVAATGDIYSGLWYPIIIAAMTLVIGMIFLRETKDVDIEDA